MTFKTLDKKIYFYYFFYTMTFKTLDKKLIKNIFFYNK